MKKPKTSGSEAPADLLMAGRQALAKEMYLYMYMNVKGTSNTHAAGENIRAVILTVPGCKTGNMFNPALHQPRPAKLKPQNTFYVIKIKTSITQHTGINSTVHRGVL